MNNNNNNNNDNSNNNNTNNNNNENNENSDNENNENNDDGVMTIIMLLMVCYLKKTMINNSYDYSSTAINGYSWYMYSSNYCYNGLKTKNTMVSDLSSHSPSYTPCTSSSVITSPKRWAKSTS
jgi:hypothetical protein